MISETEVLKLMEKERPQIEVVRSRLILTIMSVGTLLFCSYYIFGQEEIEELFSDPKSFIGIIVMFGVLMIFETIVFLRMRHLRDNGGTIARSRLVILTFVEVLFPNMIIFVLCLLDNSGYALDTPAYAAIIMLIMLSTLHLEPRLCFAAGIFAAVDHFFMVLYVWIYILPEAPDSVAMPFSMYAIRAAGLLAAGFAAGFVADQLRSRVIGTIRLIAEKQTVERLFGQQVSKEVLEALMEREGGEDTQTTVASIMFLDIRNFTTYVGSHNPAEVIAFQNKIFNPLIRIIDLHGGIINQIMGDGFMASFGLPVEDPRHCENAFNAALEILKELEKLAEAGEIPHTRVGIGLHTGEVITGNIGNDIRKQFSIAGETVVFAARVEQANKKFGTQFLISGAVRERIGNLHFPLTAQEPIMLKGFEDPVILYKVY